MCTHYSFLENAISQYVPTSICVAFVPGLVIESDLHIDNCIFLIHTPTSKDENTEQTGSLHRICFEAPGFRGPGFSIRQDNPHEATTLISWSQTEVDSEQELLALPLTALNLIFDTPWPLMCSGISFATRESKGIFIPMFFRNRRGALTPHLKHDDLDTSYRNLEEDLQRLVSTLREVKTRDPFFSTSLQVAWSADSKSCQTDQVRTRIIEYSVAMESLLLEQEAELSLRFALRCATLLSGSQDKLDPWKTAKNIYKMRCSAVHASREGVTLGEKDAETARAFLMRCMVRYLDLAHCGYKKSSIIAMLDQALLSDNYARDIDNKTLGLRRYPVRSCGSAAT